MRLLSGNPGMYQHSVQQSSEGETAPHEPEHGEDTIARVKGTHWSEVKGRRRLREGGGQVYQSWERSCAVNHEKC